MSASGEGNEPSSARSVTSPKVLESSSMVHTPSLLADVVSEMQRQIKANHALVHFLKRGIAAGFFLSGSASVSLGHTSPGGVSSRGHTPGATGTPEDSISLFAAESNVQETNAQETSFRHPLSVDLDVEPYLSQPTSDARRPGFAENVSYVSDLLQLPLKRDDSASFRNMSKQLLSIEGEARSTTSLPPCNPHTQLPFG